MISVNLSSNVVSMFPFRTIYRLQYYVDKKPLNLETKYSITLMDNGEVWCDTATTL